MKSILSKRIAAFLMVLLLSVSMFPVSVFAAEVETTTVSNEDMVNITQSGNAWANSSEVINVNSSPTEPVDSGNVLADKDKEPIPSNPISKPAASSSTTLNEVKQPENDISSSASGSTVETDSSSQAKPTISEPAVKEPSETDSPTASDAVSGNIENANPEQLAVEQDTGSEDIPANDFPVQIIRVSGGSKGRRAVARSSGTLHWDRYDEYQYDENLGSGSVSPHFWATATINGNAAYCVEPEVMDTHASKPYNSIEYNQLSDVQKYAIGYAMLYGAQDVSNVPYHIATQTIVWEIVRGHMDLESFTCANKSIYNAVIGRIPSAAPYYDQIIAQMRAHNEVPSFAHFNSAHAPTHQIQGVNGEYVLDLENTNPNCNLNDFNFQNAAGVTFTKDGQTLHVSSSAPVSATTLFSSYKGATGETNSLIFWTSTDGGDQIRATAEVLDPVPAYFRLSTEDVGEYYITISKFETGTNLPLSGAEFEVRHTEKGVVGTYTTDASGTLRVTVPWQGTYIVTELTPPENHLLDANPKKDIVVTTGNKTPEVSFHNDRFSGLKITKIDAATQQGISGVTFSVAKRGGGETTTVTTNASGVAQLPNLTPSWYVVTEIACPPEYVLDSTPHTVEILAGETCELTLENYTKPALEIKKIDADTKTPLSGATFRVALKGGKESRDVTTGADGTAKLTGLSEDYYTVREVTAPNGYIVSEQEQTVELVKGQTATVTIPNHKKPGLEIIKVDADAPDNRLEGATFRVALKGGKEYQDVTTGSSGTTHLTGLAAGYYTVCEIVAPDGYILADEEKTVELKQGETTSVTVSNHKKPALEIRKIDAVTKVPLAGATFRIALKGGKETQDITTGADGRARLTGLDPGYCTIREVTAPGGYILSNEEQTVELVQGQTASVTIANHKKPALYIEKLDSVTGQPLKNATFEVAYKNGKTLGRFTTDENGRIEFPQMEAGLVIVQEITAPDGYICTNAPQEVLLEADAVKTLRFENTPKSPVILKKVDASTGEPLAGATFRLTKMNGELVGEYTTGRSGYVTIPELEPGWYVAVEIEAPQGYRLDNTPQKVELKLGDPAILEFSDELLPGLQIRKIDAVTSKPLAGVRFRVTEKSGNVIGDYVTNGAGVITVPDLNDGWYTAFETATIDGYILDQTPQDVQLKKGQTATLEFRNVPLTGLTLCKVDAATGDPLPGAKFRLIDTNGNAVGEYKTGRGGVVTITDLEPGVYFATEIEAPAGYRLDNTPQRVEIKRGQLAVIECYNEQLPGLRIRKIDAVTGVPLVGVQFRITKKNGELVDDYTTNDAGLIVVSDLEEGWYTAYETATVDGYILDETPQDIQLKKGQTATLEFKNMPLAGLTLRKVDAVTSVPLNGATFRISKMNGERVGEYRTDRGGYITIPNLEPGWYTCVEIEAPDGYRINPTPQNVELKKGQPAVLEFENEPLPGLQIRKVDAVTGKPLAGVHFRITTKNGEIAGNYVTNAAGVITVPDLEDGWYTAFETATIDGYVLDSTPQDIQLKKGQTATLEFQNVPLTGLMLCKTDAATGDPLPGAKFRLTDTNGNVVGEYKTGRGGIVTIPDLAPGAYFVTEIEAPAGYRLDNTPQKIEIKQGQLSVLEVKNEQLPGLCIRKIDAVTGTPLAGVHFRVTKKSGDVVGNYVTDAAGMIVLPELKAGWYTVYETATINGYLLDTTPQDVQLKANKTATLEFTNAPLSGLTIRKVDAVTGEPLQGAKFKLTSISDETIGEYTTDRSGTAVIENLKPGWYVVTEIKAPDGYQLCSEPKKVEMQPGAHATVEFEDELLPGLQIRKVDALTGKPLAGIRFRVVKKTGDVVGDYTTNEAGMILVPNLKAGWYTAYELETIDGYVLDSTAQDVELKSNQTALLTFKNMSLSGLTIYKVDAVTGAGLAGVEFEVCHENGAVIGKFTTGENGRLFIPDLEAETLTIREMKTIKGYKLNTSAHTVKIESGKNNLIEIENSPYPYLVIQKIDSETGKPLTGAKFDLYSSTGQKIGTYATNSAGRIVLTGMDEGRYSLREAVAPEGYELDAQLIDVSLQWGKTTTVTFANRKLATLRIKKVDAGTKEPMPDVVFLLYDMKNNILGEYTTDDHGLIEFDQTLAEGSYKLREIKTLDGYELDEQVRTIKVRHGETTEIVWENEPLRGQIRIQKIAAEDSSITKQKKGDALAGAVFEIYNEREDVVNTITTDKKGIALSRPLPLGKYAIKEVESPDGWQINDTVFYAEIKVQNDLIQFVVEDAPAKIKTHITKRGVVEAFAGDLIKYDFSNIQNLSSVPLEDFYWHDLLPTDAVRLESIYTGTWSEELTYNVLYKTNIKGDWAMLAENLSSQENNKLDCTAAALRLASNEYVTEFRFEFGTVDVGFHEVSAPCIMTRVLANLPNEYQFVNCTDVGGHYGDHWVYDKDTWITTTHSKPKNPPKLPKTGEYFIENGLISD